ncbi:MAG: hypothetical protein ACTSPI_14185 [Candidatus Heimdallarchaeaceae archaeon]
MGKTIIDLKLEKLDFEIQVLKQMFEQIKGVTINTQQIEDEVLLNVKDKIKPIITEIVTSHRHDVNLTPAIESSKKFTLEQISRIEQRLSNIEKQLASLANDVVAIKEHPSIKPVDNSPKPPENINP